MSLDVGDGLGGVLEEDSMDATCASSRYGSLVIVEEDYLCWLYSKAFTGEFKNAPVRLGKLLLVGIHEQIAHLSKVVALLFFFPSTSKTVGEQGGLIARAQACKVGSKLGIEFAEIFFPEVSHQRPGLFLVYPHDLRNVLFHFRSRQLPHAPIVPPLT